MYAEPTPFAARGRTIIFLFTRPPSSPPPLLLLFAPPLREPRRPGTNIAASVGLDLWPHLPILDLAAGFLCLLSSTIWRPRDPFAIIPPVDVAATTALRASSSALPPNDVRRCEIADRPTSQSQLQAAAFRRGDAQSSTQSLTLVPTALP